METLPELGCDGAIVRVTNEEMRDACIAAPFPVVNFSTWMKNPGVPTVSRDDRALGVLAAQHLLEKKYRHFGIISAPGGWFIEARIKGAVSALSQSDGVYQLYKSPCIRPSTKEITHLAEWLKKLPRPAGLILTDSTYAGVLYKAISKARREIPLDFAIIGITPFLDSEPPLTPSLTHVLPDEELCGVEAVKLLERLMCGHTAKQLLTYYPAKKIVQGESSDITCYADRITAQMVDFIRRHAHEGGNATEIARALGIGQSTLFRHCQKYLGMGAHEYLSKVRIERAELMLKNRPELTIKEIAYAVGIPRYDHFYKAFTRVKGLTPSDYRAKHAK